MKKAFNILFGLCLFLTVVPNVAAEENTIQSMHIEVELHQNGFATIRETREMETFEHTELYIVLENLGDSDLMDFNVEGYTKQSDWAIDASFEEKAYRYGEMETDGGYELAWGISEYGTPTYNVTYTLSNMVRNLADGQAVFWNFDSFLSLPTDQLTFEMKAPFPLDDVVLDFYGFGFEGPMQIENGVLKWTGSDLDDSNAVTVLMQFPKDTFATTSTMDMTLEEQREMATEGSSYNEAGPMPLWATVLFVVGLTVGVGTSGLVTWSAIQRHKLQKKHDHFNGRDVIQANKEKQSPNPPVLEGEIGRYGFFLSRLVVAGGGFSNYFMAYLLTWSSADRIRIETREVERKFFGPKTDASIYIQNYDAETDVNTLTFEEYVKLFELGEATLEELFWSALLETADIDGRIDGQGIQDWSEENAKEISTLDQLITTVSTKWLTEKGYLNVFEEKGLMGKVVIQQLTAKGEAFANDLVQFHNFIKGIQEADLQAYTDWADLIVWSALFGEAKETVEYLEEFHPDSWRYLESHYAQSYGNYRGYMYFQTRSTSGLTNAGYGGSGGGGMSSGGGGGGAGGGGGGGSR